MFTFPWTPFDYSSCCCISPTVPNFSFNNYDKMQCQTSYYETLPYSTQARQTNLYPALSRMENEKISNQLHHDIMDALTLYSDNIPMKISEEKESKKETIFDLDRLIFPDDPIRDWVEKKVAEIEKGAHTMDESEYYGRVFFKDGHSASGLTIEEIRVPKFSEDPAYIVHFLYDGRLIECTRFWDGDEKFEDLGEETYSDVVLNMKHFEWYKKEEKQDMTIRVKPGDIVQLKPFDEVCDEDRMSVYGISMSVYNDLCKGPITVRKVTPRKGMDSRYDYTFDVLSNAGNHYVVPCTAIDKIFSIVDDTKTESDSVNHPSHYNQNGMEVWDVINAFTKDLSGAEAFYAGNVIKYVLRWQHKNGIEDLEKAKVYIDKIIEEEKKKKG